MPDDSCVAGASALFRVGCAGAAWTGGIVDEAVAVVVDNACAGRRTLIHLDEGLVLVGGAVFVELALVPGAVRFATDPVVFGGNVAFIARDARFGVMEVGASYGHRRVRALEDSSRRTGAHHDESPRWCTKADLRILDLEGCSASLVNHPSTVTVVAANPAAPDASRHLGRECVMLLLR